MLENRTLRSGFPQKSQIMMILQISRNRLKETNKQDFKEAFLSPHRYLKQPAYLFLLTCVTSCLRRASTLLVPVMRRSVLLVQPCTSWTSSWRRGTTWPSETGQVRGPFSLPVSQHGGVRVSTPDSLLWSSPSRRLTSVLAVPSPFSVWGEVRLI